jgi:DNA-binding NtrC family response regulator
MAKSGAGAPASAAGCTPRSGKLPCRRPIWKTNEVSVHHRILVIDQDQSVANLLSQSINSRIDCEVHSASDRAEAMALLECYAYSLVVTDHSVGQGALKDLSLEQDAAVTPLHSGLVAYSGHGNPNIRSLHSGNDAAIDPLRLNDIRKAVREALNDRDFSAHYTERSQSTARLNEFLVAGGTRVFVQPIYRID